MYKFHILDHSRTFPSFYCIAPGPKNYVVFLSIFKGRMRTKCNVLRMYCINSKVIALTFNSGSLKEKSGAKTAVPVLTIHPIDTQNSKCVSMEHCFLALWTYLCSTSLNLIYIQQWLVNSVKEPEPSVVTCIVLCHSVPVVLNNIYPTMAVPGKFLRSNIPRIFI